MTDEHEPESQTIRPVGIDTTARVVTVSSLGLDVEKTFKITASPLDEEGFYVYELTDDDGHVMADGLGDQLSDALLGLAIGVEDGHGSDPVGE